jgi:hypothetical protein
LSRISTEVAEYLRIGINTNGMEIPITAKNITAARITSYSFRIKNIKSIKANIVIAKILV